MITRFIVLLHDIALLLLIMIKSIPLRNNNYKDLTTKTRAIILCSGPSLTKDMQKIQNRSNGADLYCVNSFATTEYFKKLKPSFYVLADPMFWRDDINQSLKEVRQKTLSAISDATWPITIVCSEAGKIFLNDVFIESENIRIVGVKRNECNFKQHSFHMFALKFGFATPNFINVLILAIWWCIENKVNDIELFGADFSQHLGLKLDQESGEAMSGGGKHFYENQKEKGLEKMIDQKYIGRPQKKMHERFFQIWTAFHQIYLLSELCKIKKLNLINFSSTTNIDTIKRSD